MESIYNKIVTGLKYFMTIIEECDEVKLELSRVIQMCNKSLEKNNKKLKIFDDLLRKQEDLLDILNIQIELINLEREQKYLIEIDEYNKIKNQVKVELDNEKEEYAKIKKNQEYIIELRNRELEEQRELMREFSKIEQISNDATTEIDKFITKFSQIENMNFDILTNLIETNIDNIMGIITSTVDCGELLQFLREIKIYLRVYVIIKYTYYLTLESKRNISNVDLVILEQKINNITNLIENIEYNFEIDNNIFEILLTLLPLDNNNKGLKH